VSLSGRYTDDRIIILDEFDGIIEEIVDHLLELDLVDLEKSYISIEL
jgi:hypothetical protein